MDSGISYGVLIAGVIIAWWYYWAITVYKYSDARLSGMILTKYQSIPAHADLLTDDLTFAVKNIVISQDKSSVSANVLLQNKTSGVVKSQDLVIYGLSGTCGYTDLNCIAV
jgi:hypothetical protein